MSEEAKIHWTVKRTEITPIRIKPEDLVRKQKEGYFLCLGCGKPHTWYVWKKGKGTWPGEMFPQDFCNNACIVLWELRGRPILWKEQ
jgi:hypothetical protein